MSEFGQCHVADLAALSRFGNLAEEFATVVGVPAIVVHGTPPADNAEQLQDLVQDLVSLPCVVIAAPDSDPRLLPYVDIAPAADELDAVLATVAQHPIAATTLALVLRDGANRTIDAGLVAESASYSLLQAGPEFAGWRSSRAIRHASADGPDAVPVRLERHGDTLAITLSRPHVHNAYSSAMRDALWEALQVARADPGLRVVLRGEGPSFCSGGDLDEFGTRSDPASAHTVRLARTVARTLARIAPRVEVRVHGACIGSGAELAAFAGLVVADPETRFALPEVGMGLIPGAGGTVSLPLRIGRHRTALLALLGRPIDAPTALAWGLVDRIEPTRPAPRL